MDEYTYLSVRGYDLTEMTIQFVGLAILIIGMVISIPLLFLTPFIGNIILLFTVVVAFTLVMIGAITVIIRTAILVRNL